MEKPQKILILNALVVGPVVILAATDALKISEGTPRTVLTFAVCPIALLLARYLALGWKEVKSFAHGAKFVICIALCLHLAFSDYTGWDTYRGEDIIEDKWKEEPGLGATLGLWLGLIAPATIFGGLFFQWYLRIGGPGSKGKEEEVPRED